MTLDRELTPYEVEVGDAMMARRDAATRLVDVLNRDVLGYDNGMERVREGRAMEILVPPEAGQIRQDVSDAVTEFEAARHRFRLALVALGVDHGMTARQVGDAFAFSRQLASRYLKEARAKWPGLQSLHEEDFDEGDGDSPA
jgi:hypothetical protein